MLVTSLINAKETGRPKYDYIHQCREGKGAALTGQNKDAARPEFIILQLFIGHQGESDFNPLPHTARLRRYRCQPHTR